MVYICLKFRGRQNIIKEIILSYRLLEVINQFTYLKDNIKKASISHMLKPWYQVFKFSA